ncbi:MAG: DUF3810 domain-containing protein [Acidobacteriota bacterium]
MIDSSRVLPEEDGAVATPLVSRKVRWRGVISLGLLPVAFLLQLIANFHPELIEHYYSRGLYPYIGRGLAFVNGLCGFSLAEALTGMLLGGICLGGVWQARRLYLGHARLSMLLRVGLFNLLGVAGVIAILFLLLWGLNYERQPLLENLRLARREASADELEAICRAVISETNRSYEEANAGAKTDPSQLSLSWVELDSTIESAYQREPLLGSAAKGGFGPPKPVYFSQIMSRLGIAGIYVPFTGEPNFNAELPGCEIPYTIAHEKAHQRGFALEDEANFIAFLVCIKSTDPYARYSGYLMAATQLLRALNLAAPDRYQSVFATLGVGPRADLKAIREFWTRYEGRLSQVSETINNTYLKANRIESGVENYSEAVALILSYYFTYPSGDAANLPQMPTY